MTTRSLLLSLLATTALGDTLAAPATAQTPPAQSQPSTAPQAQPTQLDAVTTAATRTKRPIDEVPGTISVITTQDIDRDNVQDMRDLVRNEPGVSVGNQPARGGFSNFVIRGIGGNRVVIMSDGVRVPDFPGSNAASPTGYTRDFIDLESVKQVEILRGPASALYGSDALGGVVAYTTKDPSDYLVFGGKNYFASIKGAFSGADNSFAETATAAVRAGNVEFMGIYTRRDGGSMQLANSSLAPNPEWWGENNFLGKLVFRPTDNDTIRLVGEYYARNQTTEGLSNMGDFPSLFAKIYDEGATDYNKRSRISAQWVHDAPVGFVDRIDLLAYFTQVIRQEDTFQLRGPNNGWTPSNFRFSSFWYTQNIYGTELQLNTNARILDLSNTFTYGLSFSYTTTSRPRNRQQVTMSTGIATQTSGGETFPNKNFPDTNTVQIGAYLQDEITAGRLTITPAVRLDYYNLNPNPDADFWRSSGAVNLLPTQSIYWSASPKLGLLYKLTEEYSGYFQYARGFRAPPYDNANFAFNNATSFYQILPNANLKPETADSFEIGARGKYRNGSSWQLAGFYNLYSNFIDTVVVGMAGPITQFQYVNLGQVNIWGVEARGDWRFLPDWGLLGYFAYAHGTDQATGLPVDSVDPWKASARLRYGYQQGFGAQLIGTLVGAHDQVSNPTYFQAPGYFTLDATVGYNFEDRIKVNVGAFNITNAKYWNSQDVIGVAATNTQLDRYVQPGRYFGANLTMKW
ncbi:MAG TPA: TonB-dependent hemoglobin/transferrin/lactoferrin family receptor [Reyranella sp.]